MRDSLKFISGEIQNNLLVQIGYIDRCKTKSVDAMAKMWLPVLEALTVRDLYGESPDLFKLSDI